MKKIAAVFVFLFMFCQIPLSALVFKGWFVLIQFEPVYNSDNFIRKSKMSFLTLLYIGNNNPYLDNNVDLNCYIPKNSIRISPIWAFRTQNMVNAHEKFTEITMKRFHCNDEDSVFNYYYFSGDNTIRELLDSCCSSLKNVESRKLHFFYGRIDGEYVDKYRELVCDDMIIEIDRYLYYPIEEFNVLEYKYSIVLPKPNRTIMFWEDFRFRTN